MNNRGNTQKRGRSRPRLEPLETRTVPAGDVTAMLFGGDLVVRGDNDDNAVAITVTDGDLVVMGLEDTTINGGNSAVFEGVSSIADDLKVSLLGGEDTVVVHDLGVNDDATIFADQVVLDNVEIDDDLSIRTGFGADSVLLDSVFVGDDTSIRTSFGEDNVVVNNSNFGDRLSINTGFDDDLVLIDPTSVGGRADVKLSFGDDTLVIAGANEFNSRVKLSGGFGDDAVMIDDATVFAASKRIRGFESVNELVVPTIRFSVGEGLTVRNILNGDLPGSGSTDFSLSGANFSGGEVIFAGNSSFYASPPEAYHVDLGAEITFDAPIRLAQFFFVHLPGGPTLRATAYNGDDVVGTVESNPATFLNDPANYVTLTGTAPITRIVIDGGNLATIDNFSFVV